MQAAFDSVRHDFLFGVLDRQGVSPRFVALLRGMYVQASSRVRANGNKSHAFYIGRSVRQGCPSSALLFAVAMSPLLHRLADRLHGLRLADSRLIASAYADDVYALLCEPAENIIAAEVLEQFGDQSGLRTNKAKSAALPLGGWDADVGLPVVTDIKVLGVHFAAKATRSIALNFDKAHSAVTGALAANSTRALSLSQRGKFAATYGLSKIWHAAQVYPLCESTAKNIIKAVNNFVWRGQLFRVSAEIVTTPRAVGGLGLLDVRDRCRALLVGRWHGRAINDPDSLSAEWLLTLQTAFGVGNPPNLRAVWPAAPHYKQYWECASYTALPGVAGTPSKEVVRALSGLLQDDRNARAAEPRVVAKFPRTDWRRVWANVRHPCLGIRLQDAWWTAVHDLLPTNTRLQQIRRATSDTCVCGARDDLEHRLAGCGNAATVWPWVRVTMRRLTGRTFTPAMLLRPDFAVTDKAKQAAAVWVAATTVAHFGRGPAPATAFVAKVQSAKRQTHNRELAEGLALIQ